MMLLPENAARCFCRMRAIRVRSISKNEVTCAFVRREATMCSLVSERIFDIGSAGSPGPRAGPRLGHGAVLDGAGRRVHRRALRRWHGRRTGGDVLLDVALGDATLDAR